MVTKRLGRAGRVRVTFALPAAIWADSVTVVGDFNDWDSRATPLRLSDSGWMATIDLDAGRTYAYRYLLNGNEWCNDWQADGYEASLSGGANSILNTTDVPEDIRSNVPARPNSFIPKLRLVSSGSL
ncbi:MAG: glycoside hydrolase family 13 [Oscillochloris sp.]|nr:glycoside hydrolase family 13 [Oscillochloris sp.]